MERRLFVVLAAVAVAVVIVGLSAAARMSQDQGQQPGPSGQSKKGAKSPQPARMPAKTTRKKKASSETVISGGRPQSAKDIEEYWTKERMDDAMEKTRPGGSPSSSPAPSGTVVPGGPPTKQSTPQRARAKTSRSAGDGVVTTPSATPNSGYWTEERMDGAQPMDMTRPGGSGSQESPDLGGTTVPGSPPP